MPRPQPRSRRRPSRGRSPRAQEGEVEGVVAQLAAGELPGEDAGGDVAARGLVDERLDVGVAPAGAGAPVGEAAEERRQEAAHDQASHQQIDAELPGPEVPQLGEREGERRRAAEEPAGVDLGEDEDGPQERQAHVGGDIGADLVQAEEPRHEDAERQVETVEGAAADEHAGDHRPGLARRGLAFGAEVVEQLAERPAPSGRRRGRGRRHQVFDLAPDGVPGDSFEVPPISRAGFEVPPISRVSPGASKATGRRPRAAMPSSTRGSASRTTGAPPAVRAAEPSWRRRTSPGARRSRRAAATASGRARTVSKARRVQETRARPRAASAGSRRKLRRPAGARK